MTTVEAVVERAATLPADATVTVLAGRGVVDDGRVDGLRRFAERAGLGVLNTWGAKGVFEWRSPHHLGTAGLQERDFELGGIAGADLVVATGVDPAEAPPRLWRVGEWVEVDPADLGELAERWPRAAGEPERPPLYTRLAEVVQPLFRAEEVPLLAPRAVLDLKEAVPPEGRIVAEPGPAGLWVARAFPTSELGSVWVPATRERGVARAVAERWTREGHPVVLVAWSSGGEGETAPAAESGRGASLVVDVWGPRGSLRSADEHGEALRRGLDVGGTTVLTTPVDLSPTAALVGVAGPVIAWDGLLASVDWRSDPRAWV